jgi:hypothetical protein
MEGWTRIRWFPFEVFFGLQRCIWWLFLRTILPDCREYVDSKVVAKGTANTETAILDEIYKFLGILDAKASALMRYNGIILAVIGLMVRSGQKLPDAAYYIVYMTIGSIIACLLVVGVFWRFLDWVSPNNEDGKLATELDMIRRVLVLREAAYQIAWWLSAAVSFLLLFKFTEFVAPK